MNCLEKVPLKLYGKEIKTFLNMHRFTYTVRSANLKCHVTKQNTLFRIFMNFYIFLTSAVHLIFKYKSTIYRFIDLFDILDIF